MTSETVAEEKFTLDMEEKASCLEVIETVIASLDQSNSAMVTKREEGHIWKFQYGSVDVLVHLTGESDDDLLTIWSPVLDLPAQNELELMRQLLEMNWSATFESCFSIVENQIVIGFQRTIAGLNPGEISRAITLVATIADEHDEILQEKFGITPTT